MPEIERANVTLADEVIADFLESIERGESPEPRVYLTQYPHLMAELSEFFAGFGQLNRIPHRAGTGGPQAFARADGSNNPFGPTVFTPNHEPAETDFIGHSIKNVGDYELIAEIARGGMGVVFQARQVSLNRVVALKMILAGAFATDDDIKRFLQEAEAAAQLDHPGIVPIFEVGLHQGHHYFSMGFVDGTSLARQLSDGPLPPKSAAEIVRQVAEAVHYAHSKGVIHRDLKPSNILIDMRGQPRVSDFGLAKRLEGGSELTGTGQIIGTPSYMPPEQVDAHLGPVGTWSDVYSLGAVLYCALTGRPPFQAATALDTLMQVQRQDPVSLRSLNEKIPVDLETIALKCLDKSPVRRYQTARELADELQRFLDNRPILASPVGRLERAIRWCRRNPTVTGLSTLVLITLMISTIVSGRFAYRESKQALAEAFERQKAVEQATIARLNLYVAHMNLAQAAWENSRVLQTIRLLDIYRPVKATKRSNFDPRGFEWYYWDHWCHSELATLTGHTDDVECVSVSLDGKRLVSASADRSIKLWDLETGQLLSTLNEHTDAVYGVAISPDGEWIASAGDITVKLWPASGNQKPQTIARHTARVMSVAFSPNGKKVASASWDGTIKLWDVEAARELRTMAEHTDEVWSVSFSPDGNQIASASADHTVKLWDTNSGQCLRTLEGHTDRVMAVAFGPDGNFIASAGRDYTIIIWEALTGQISKTLKGHVDRVTSVAFSPDGSRLASASRDQTIKVWDLQTGSETRTFRGHTDRVTSVVFTRDGQRLISASWDDTIKIWDLNATQESLTLRGNQERGDQDPGHQDEVHCVAFSPDSQLLASASWDGTVKIWDPSTGRLVSTLQDHHDKVSCVAFNANGSLLASASHDQTVKLWDPKKGKALVTLMGHSANVLSVTFIAQGNQVASGDADGIIKIWDAETAQKLRSIQGHAHAVTSLTSSTDGAVIASSSDDGTINLWDVSNGLRKHQIKTDSGSVTCVSFSLDGQQLAAASTNKSITIWDATTRKIIRTLNGHTDVVTSVAFSPDGKRIASASDDRTVKVWDTVTGQETLNLNGHTDEVLSVAFSRDGTDLASASWDKSIKIWSARPIRR